MAGRSQATKLSDAQSDVVVPMPTEKRACDSKRSLFVNGWLPFLQCITEGLPVIRPQLAARVNLPID